MSAVAVSHISPLYYHPVGFPRATSSRSTVDRLNREWEAQRTESAEWMTPPLPLEMVLQSIRFNPDQVLSTLITACQSGHHQAGRVVVQALLPKLILLSCTSPYPGLDDMLASLWLRLARYSLSRRPRSIAANLVLDARKDALAETRPIRLVAAPPEESGPSAQAILNAARRLGLATVESLNIVESVYVDELPRSRVAEAYSMTVEAVRRRCCDTLRRLRENRELLAECA